jgi:outer membrane protein OmpA-like peptidoglycan-associated protein
MTMNMWKTLPFATALLVLQAGETQITPPAQIPAQAVSPGTVPLYRIVVVQGSAKAINYRTLTRSATIDLMGTALVSNASGTATVSSEGNAIEVKVKVKNLPPASSFGGEFLTYVVWGISPEGRATNLGELVLEHGKGKVKVTEQLKTFGLVVTAEPYFAVSQPSDVVVLENVFGKEAPSFEFIDAKYELLKRGQYTLNLTGNEPMAMDKKVPLEVYEARNAVRIAEAAGAATYAPEALGKAQNFLKQADNPDGGKKARIQLARETVQRAEDARLISVQKQAKEQLAWDQRVAQDKLDAANQAAAAAAAAGEAANRQNAMAAKENDALRSTNQELWSKNEGLKSKNDGLQSTNDGLQSNNDGLRTQLMEQLNTILQTRATARGLIVNMSGVLFQSGKATLLPIAREKLAKVAGVLATHKGLVIETEGFTDSIGGSGMNQRLSEQRAKNTMDYLVSQGVPATAISFKGFGEESPIASNDTSAGRQENRRVELVVSGEGITPARAAGL